MPVKSYSDSPAPDPASASPTAVPVPGDTTGTPAAIPFPEKLVARVESTRFDPSNPPPVEPWAFKLAGVEVAHSGNLVTIAAAVKSGKSSVISAMIASMMGAEGRDYLALDGSNPDGKAVLHYDTEQSRGDHYHMISTQPSAAPPSVRWLARPPPPGGFTRSSSTVSPTWYST